ncbi:MAG: 3-oxoacyl-[acyl-carrier-protein] reductase [Ignavibacteriaceae bacterium]
MIDLKNKTVLITGGSRGIGAACVRAFSYAGANIVFTCKKSVSAAEKLIGSIKSPVSVKYYQVDVTDYKEVKKVVRKTAGEFGSIDILVNNAGIWKHAPLPGMSEKQWNETISVNLTGAFYFTKAVLPFMIRKKTGRIINITSTAGQRGEAEYSHYAASKGGLISFTKSLAAELGKYNINVNSVAPGWVITDMTSRELSDSDYLKTQIAGIPLGRIATPDDIAGPVLFLASDLANHITGEILNVNGGSVLCG